MNKTPAMTEIKDNLLEAKESQRKTLERLEKLKANSDEKRALELDKAIREIKKGLKIFPKFKFPP